MGDEIGSIEKDAPEAVALLYPSPYRVGMSSLGYQTIYRAINATEGRAAHRAFLPDDIAAWQQSRLPLVTYEKLRPISDYPVIAVSVAYETELAGLIQALELAGIPPLAEDRTEQHPFILAGGPLTFSNPLPLAPFVDAMIMGEADQSVHTALGVIFGSDSKDSAMSTLASQPHVFVPTAHGDILPPIDKADTTTLPAFSQIITPHTELRNMFLIEPERGCHRGCTYCVMRRSTNDGMRIVKKERILSLIPDDAKKVGLVGAATTDHPQIIEVVNALVDSGREVGLSSLRADRLNDDLVAALRRGGHRILTTASDGASQRMRDVIQRKTTEEQLRQAAKLARRHGMKRLKLYIMVGLPSETDDDIDELIEFGKELSSLIPLSLGVAPSSQSGTRRSTASPSPACPWWSLGFDGFVVGFRAESTFARLAPGGPGWSTCWRRGAALKGWRCSMRSTPVAASPTGSVRSTRSQKAVPAACSFARATALGAPVNARWLADQARGCRGRPVEAATRGNPLSRTTEQ